jgi:alpha-glucosidase
MFILFTEIQLKTTFMFQKIICIAATFLLLTACQKATTSQTEGEEELTVPPCVVSSPPDSLHLDKFYSKYVDVNGLPLISSWRVPDSCFVAAHRTLYAMTSMLAPEIIEAMKKANARVAIMARYEGTTDLPEHHYLINDTTLNWDLRARGLGGTIEEPLTSCAEENILAYQIDKYHAEDILIHEFAHSIHLIGFMLAVPDFDSRLKACYEAAKAKGILDNTYRITDKEEYFAEAVQDWFNVNAEMPHTDGKHNWCNTREELLDFDPDLYHLLEEYFPKTNLQISKHKKVNQWKAPL